jgi:4'-phosphopantetheinyl transferase
MSLDGLEAIARRSAAAAAAPCDTTVWVVRLDLEASALSCLEAILSPDEGARAARFRRPAARARFIAGRAQLRQVLGARIGADPAAIRFDYSLLGKPSLAKDSDAMPLHFNASGSEALALVALRRGAEVGVDLECLRPTPHADSLAARLLSAAEHAEYSRLPAAERRRRFLEYWVRKEALAKSLGTGLRERFDRLSLFPWPEESVCRIDLPRDGGTMTQWVAPLSLPDAGYVGAIASSEPVDEVKVRPWPPRV